jgi:UDP-glucose 4-epimerase
MNFLITGGSGYLAGRLAEFLAKKNHYVRLASRSPLSLRPQNTDTILIDWDSPETIAMACENIETIIHTAGMNARESEANPVHSVLFNTILTGKLMAIAVAQKVKKFIYFSTAHVYNSPLTGEIDEETCPRNHHPYASSHRAAEDLLKFYSEKSTTKSIILRLSNSYGAPFSKNSDCWGLLFNDICRQIVTTRKVILNSRGSQRRDFIPLAMVEQATEYLAHLNFAEPFKLLNLGSAWAPTILEATEFTRMRCHFLFGFLPELILTPNNPREADTSLRFDISRLRETGFSLIPDQTVELDQLLVFCQDNF